METLTVAYNERYGIPKYAGLTMTKAEFLRWESDDNYVYEFNNGVLEPTTSMKQIEVMRRPDVALFSREQFQKMATGDNAIPAFVVEFVSENDDARQYIKNCMTIFRRACAGLIRLSRTRPAAAF
ncbi:hypothetical protein [Spirosoma montaniterrae]|uniref:Restriction endonuclease domain-containing protein n=1 Tax=Spirosoma montaniterrae TaxID=1178516 RepID=A0A1P9WUD0_9BACT|nr:hypothetical protein [Spirosoma montaniterrae]AQG78987.1 hypothetical protein AWR27_06385 [Spirosoma montaniterrae]